MPSETTVLPKRWFQLKHVLEKEEWKLDRISGSHHIFTKPKCRCIPVAFHGGTVSRRYASLILKQAGLAEDENSYLLESENTCVEEIARSTQLIDIGNEDEEVAEKNSNGVQKKQKNREEKIVRE